MAVRHRLIHVGPSAVWDVLEDGSRYAEWVVGTARSEPVRGQWPQEGAAIRYEIRIGPARLANETVVRRYEEGRLLELEAKAGPLGTARISIEVRPWGEKTLVIVDEHPLQGAGGMLHNAGFEALIQLRHRTMLARLARICEGEATSDERPDRQDTAGPAEAYGAGHA
ncbi:SRPBCC family protein [Streptomyces sp. KAU_LT]|uniref:SRPBCC family protein n=1 Tax=Streptomyces sp. KAU_LT TaxID=3046669 RepID=UPI0024B7000C|nr:SRPBCC family protein [Streptomyces sp. KAU_LT]MDI9835403.1 SRPBCC family protein [Streptomyces sp. KAU_LT]